jgi:hypothetical protein
VFRVIVSLQNREKLKTFYIQMSMTGFAAPDPTTGAHVSSRIVQMNCH